MKTLLRNSLKSDKHLILHSYRLQFHYVDMVENILSLQFVDTASCSGLWKS